MTKYIASIVGLALALAFVVVFSVNHADSKELSEVAPRVGISYEELMAMGPRVATHTGVTLGTSRHVVFLLACSGQSSKNTLEGQATQATALAKEQHLSDREAVTAVLHSSVASETLKGC
jgi:hypothetical protein